MSVICMSLIGVVSAADTFIIPTISNLNITPTSSIALPTIHSGTSSSTPTTSSDIVSPSLTTKTPQTQSALPAISIQTPSVNVSSDFIFPTENTLISHQSLQLEE